VRALSAVLAAWLLVTPELASAAEVAADSTRAAARSEGDALRKAAIAMVPPCDDPRFVTLQHKPAIQRTDEEQAYFSAQERKCAAYHAARVAEGLENPNHTVMWFGLALGALACVGVWAAIVQMRHITPWPPLPPFYL